MRNPELLTADGANENIASLYYKDNCSVIKIVNAVEESSTGEELSANLNKLKLFSKFYPDRETADYARVVMTDPFGNKHYLKAEK
ncbi:MAG: hypothetical protein IJT21_04655 [Synergistaceae bacterium]|nr:hypothetical protein [Synergistaceae bacterium]